MRDHPLNIDLDRWTHALLLFMKASSSVSAFELSRTIVTKLLDTWRMVSLAPSCGRNGFLTLPTPALQLVFRYLVPRDRLYLAQSAQRIRYFALAHPEIFNDISILSLPCGVDTAKLMSAMLKKSSPRKPLKLEFWIDVWDSSGCDACFSIVGAHLQRVSKLSLQLSRLYHTADNGIGLHWQAVGILDSYLSSPAPVLRRLDISIGAVRGGISPPIAPTIFNGYAPQLTECHLKNVSLRGGNYTAFSHLVALTYYPRPRTLTLIALRSILTSCPRLLYLELGIQKFDQSGEDTAALLPARATLPNVHVDWLRECSKELIDHLMHTHLQRLVCFRSIALNSAGWLPFLPLFTISRLELGLAVCEAEACHESTGRPLLLRFRSMRPTRMRASMFTPDAYALLTSLSIHEFYWPGPESQPDMPSVTSLRILLASCSDVVATRNTIAGIFQATSAWNLPCMRTLQFTYRLASPCEATSKNACCYSNRLTLSLGDVHSFVARCIQPSDRRLASITLSGVEVIDHLPATWIERFNELADLFTLLPTCTPISADAPRRVWYGDFKDMFQDYLVELCQ